MAADVEELVRHVEWRLALEHLAGDRVRPVARTAGSRQVLAARLDRHAQDPPLGGPFQVPAELGTPTERTRPAGLPAAARPAHQPRAALVEDPLAVPLRDDGRADLAARLAHDLDRVPVGRMLDVGHAPVDIAYPVGPVQGEPDVRIDCSRGVHLAHPVVPIRADAEARKEVDEDLGMVARVRGVTIAGLVRDVREWAAHLRLDRIRRQQGLGVHGVQVVHAVEQGRVEVAGAQCTGDRVEDDGATQAADVDGPRRRLAVIDDLRAADCCGEFVGPVHRVLVSGAWPGQRMLTIV